MNKPIILTEEKWRSISEQIRSDRPPSIFVSWKMRAVLGFTVRRHEEWVDAVAPQLTTYGSATLDAVNLTNRKMLKESVHLDVYSEPKKTMFVLRYM